MDISETGLNETNFILFAMNSYDNRNCLDLKEFYDDLKKIKYIKRLLNRYLKEGELKERLILNHIIELYNMFGNNATVMLFYKLENEFHPLLKTFLVYLGRMPDEIFGARDEVICSNNIAEDLEVANTLRKI